MKNLFLLGLLLPLSGVCQKIENLEVATAGDKIVITYDIHGGVTGDTYDVALYTSHNNFRSPVRLVSGEVGREQTEGRRKKIEWDAKAELGNYAGDLSFELHANVNAALAILSKTGSVKRGKDLELTWRGGALNQDVKIELLQAGATERTIAILPNTGSWQWNVESNQAIGKNFQVRIVSGKEAAVSAPFSIRHKIPTALKVAPLALLTIFAYPASASGTTDASRTPSKLTSASLN